MLGELLSVCRRIFGLRPNFLKHSQNSHLDCNDPALILSSTVGLLFSLFKLCGWKNICKQLKNSGLRSRSLFCLTFQFYLLYKLICRKPAHFLSAQMAFVRTFSQMFIVLGMYNFATYPNIRSLPMQCVATQLNYSL